MNLIEKTKKLYNYKRNKCKQHGNKTLINYEITIIQTSLMCTACVVQLYIYIYI